MRIPDYPAPDRAISGEVLLAAWQDGQQVAIRVDSIETAAAAAAAIFASDAANAAISARDSLLNNAKYIAVANDLGAGANSKIGKVTDAIAAITAVANMAAGLVNIAAQLADPNSVLNKAFVIVDLAATTMENYRIFNTAADAGAAAAGGGIPDNSAVTVIADETQGGNRSVYFYQGGVLAFKYNPLAGLMGY